MTPPTELLVAARPSQECRTGTGRAPDFSATSYPPQPADGTPVHAGFGGSGPELPPSEPELLLLRFSALIESRVGLVRPHLLRASFDRDDLRQEARLALIRAARKFDPSRGVPFLTFAKTVVDHAIADVLRAHDPLPTSARRDLKALAEHESTSSPEGRCPVSAQRAAVVRSWDRAARVVSLEIDLDGMSVVDRSAGTPEDQVVSWDEARQVRIAVARLPERTRRILLARVVDGKPLREVAAAEGLSVVRVWQIQEQGRVALSAALSNEI